MLLISHMAGVISHEKLAEERLSKLPLLAQLLKYWETYDIFYSTTFSSFSTSVTDFCIASSDVS